MDNEKNKNVLSKNLRYYMNIVGKSRNEICADLDIKYTTFTDWLNGNSYPRINKIDTLATYFGIMKADLVEDHGEMTPNRIKVFGHIPGDTPLDEINDVEGWADIPSEWTKDGSQFIGFTIKDSTMSPKYVPGDVVIIKLQSESEAWQDCLVSVHGTDAILTQIIRQKGSVLLQQLNSTRTPRVYRPDVSSIKVLGIAKEIRRKV